MPKNIDINSLDINSLGEIASKDTFFIRVEIGTAIDKKTELEYDLSLINGTIPTVRSKSTGKFSALPLDDLLQLAVFRGIDEE